MASETAAAEEETPKVTTTSTVGDISDVIIHPLVLLSAADHYHRVARGTRKRVVGVLLGQVVRGKVEANNSFALPFEEDSRNPVSLNAAEEQGRKGATSMHTMFALHLFTRLQT
jgi:26S proteasome regulatory subunit N8